MKREQKIAQRFTTTFTVSMLLMPVLYYMYVNSQAWMRLCGFLLEANFVIFAISGSIGTYKTSKINHRIEQDILSKLADQGIKVQREGFDDYRLPAVSGRYKIDFSSIPSDSIDIDTKKRIIRYK